MSKRRQDKLVGSLLSLPTFTDEDHSLRLDRQRIHLDWIIENGFTEGNGVLLSSGGLGEGAFLRDSEWQTLAELTVEVAAGRVPTAAGVTELSARSRRRQGQAGRRPRHGLHSVDAPSLHGPHRR